MEHLRRLARAGQYATHRVARRALAAVMLTTPLASAHFVLQSPASWMSQDSSGNPQKAGPCGDEGGGTATGTVTTFAPGDSVTITIKETVFHPGHYRIALAESRDALPAEPKVTAASTPCGSVPVDAAPAYPVLADGVWDHSAAFSGPQSVKVTLPSNVTCSHCTLQIIEFMSNHSLNNPGGCFYHHCADIAIVPAGAGGTAATGGAPSSRASGGTAATGGAPSSRASGGTVATGGAAAAGGTRAIVSGGAAPTGGRLATGGLALGTGGTLPAGGSATTANGGTHTTGGTRATSGGSAGGGTGGLSLADTIAQTQPGSGGALQATGGGTGGTTWSTSDPATAGAGLSATEVAGNPAPSGCSCAVAGAGGRLSSAYAAVAFALGVTLLRARRRAQPVVRRVRH